MRYRHYWLLLAAVICMLAGGCAKADPPVPFEYVIGVSQANMREPWRLVLADELKREAAKYPQVRLVFADATADSKKQIADIGRLQEYGIDLLIVSPCDAEQLTPVISQVYQQIPVIVLDRMVEGYDYSLFIGPDNTLIGREIGDAVLEMAGGEPYTVLELRGNEESKSTQDRSLGFRESIAGHANIRVESIAVQAESKDAAEDAVITFDAQLNAVNTIFAHNDYMALGAYLALDKLGRGDIRIVGIDGFEGENGGLEMVRSGKIDRTITCPTGGREAITYAIDILDGVSGIPKQIILRSDSIDDANLDAYVRELGRESASPQESIRVGYAQLGTESGWRLANNRSILDAAQAFGVELTMLDANNSQPKQIENIRAFIAQEVDVIVLSPVIDTGWDEVLREARQAGIPVILSDRKVQVADDSLYATFIGADFIEEGRRAFRWISENVQPADPQRPVRVLEIQGTIGATPTIERKAGFETPLAASGRYEIVYSASGDFTLEGGRQVIADYLQSHPAFDIDVIYAHNDDMAIGAIDALEAAQIRPGTDVAIVSIDGTRKAVEALADGRMNCVVECSPMLGPQLMKAIIDLSSGQRLPLRIITDEIVFTQDNAREELPNRNY